MVSQQHFGSEPLKALKLKLAAVKTHSYNSLCVCLLNSIFSLCFHGFYTKPLWDYAGRRRLVSGFLKSLQCEDRSEIPGRVT